MKGQLFPVFLTAALLITSVLGCIQETYKPESGVCTIRTEMDEKKNYMAARTEDNQLDKGLDLNVWLHQQGDNKDLQLVVIYKGLDWLFVKPEETLTLHVDRQRMELTGEGGIEPRSALSRWWIMEMASYDLTIEQLRMIAHAREAVLIIKNSEYAFSADNFECFRKFYEEYVAGKAGPGTGTN